MTTPPKAVQPIPKGHHHVTPWIISPDTAKRLDGAAQRTEAAR